MRGETQQPPHQGHAEAGGGPCSGTTSSRILIMCHCFETAECMVTAARCSRKGECCRAMWHHRDCHRAVGVV